MDVNNLGQNSININAYKSNLSDYAEANTEVAVPQVQQIETKSSRENAANSRSIVRKIWMMQ